VKLLTSLRSCALTLVAVASALSAQTSGPDTLTAAQAVAIALDHNFGIQIARNQLQQARNTNKLRVGALLPTLRLDGEIAYSDVQTPSTPPRSTTTNGTSSSGAAVLSWTLFDGFKMFYANTQIGQRIALSSNATRHDIESAVVSVLGAFYQASSSLQLLHAARAQLDLSRSQVSRQQTQLQFGRITSDMLLRSQVLLNADSAAVAARQLDSITALQSLNIALGRSPSAPLSLVTDTTIPPPQHDPSWWYERARQHNAGLQMARIQLLIAASQQGIEQAAYWPTLIANASYTQSWGANEFSRSGAGVALKWQIFNGFKTTTAVQNSQLQHNSAQLGVEQTALQLQALIYRQWAVVENGYRQINFERQAVALAQQLIARGEQQYAIGQLSDLQFRELQQELLRAQVRLETVLFQYLLANAQLHQLAGELQL
jgi:outer membrane protein TolC